MTTRTSDVAIGQSAAAGPLVLGKSARHERGALAGPLKTSHVVQRFGTQIDVRNRGALRLGPSMRSVVCKSEQPAVVRIWYGEQCRELSAHEARALAAQLTAAAAYADQQNTQ